MTPGITFTPGTVVIGISAYHHSPELLLRRSIDNNPTCHKSQGAWKSKIMNNDQHCAVTANNKDYHINKWLVTSHLTQQRLNDAYTVLVRDPKFPKLSVSQVAFRCCGGLQAIKYDPSSVRAHLLGCFFPLQLRTWIREDFHILS